jgi:hypothetical protein
MLKTLRKLEIQRNFLSDIEVLYKILQIVLSLVVQTKCFLQKVKTKPRRPPLTMS